MKSFRAKLAKIPKEAMGEIAKAIEVAANEAADREFSAGVGAQGKAFAPRVDGKASNLGGRREWVTVRREGDAVRVIANPAYTRRTGKNPPNAPILLFHMVRSRRWIGSRKLGTRELKEGAAPGRPVIPYPKRLPVLWSLAFRKAVTKAKNLYLKQLKASAPK